MNFESSSPRVPFSASRMWAHKRLLSCMSELMRLQVPLRYELLIALRADKWPFPCMRAHMCFEVASFWKLLQTLFKRADELKGEARINKNWHHNITGIKCGSSYTYIMPMSLLRRNDHREIRFYWVHADSIHPFPLYFKLHGNTNLGLLCTVRDRVWWRLFLGYLWFFEVEVVKMVVHQFRLVSD